MILLGVLLIAVSLLILIACCLGRLSLSKMQWYIFGMISIGGLVFIAFSIDPPNVWDLTRHYDLIKKMQYGGWEFVFNQSEYAHLPIINILYGVIAAIGIPELLPCIVLIICYLVLAVLIKKSCAIYKLDSRFIAFAILFNLALCPFLHMVSGIRNILAYTLCAWILYMDIYEKRNPVFVWILYISTIFIHPSSLLVIGVRCVIPIFVKWRWTALLMLCWSLLANIIQKILIKIPIGFLQSVGWKLQDYMTQREFSGYKILLVKYVMLISIIFVIEYVIVKKEDYIEQAMRRYILAFECLVVITIGAFKVVFIADRLSYLIAFAAIPILAFLYKECKEKVRWIFGSEMILISMLFYVYQCLYFGQDLIR